MAFICLFFILATLIKRARRIKNKKRAKLYNEQIEQILFPLLLGTTTNVAAVSSFLNLDNNKLLKKIAIRAIISLHQNYTGTTQKALETFFISSGLKNYSFSKLDSSRWEFVIEGIRDLSILSVDTAFGPITEKLNNKNGRVRKEAIIGLITLKGINGLLDTSQTTDIVDDWTQSCILHNLLNRENKDFERIEELLYAENDSIALLAIRIIELFNIPTDSVLIENRMSRMTNAKLKLKAIEVFNLLIEKQHV